MCNSVYIKIDDSVKEIEYLSDLKSHLEPVLLDSHNPDCLNKDNICCCPVDWAKTAKKNKVRIINTCDGVYIGHDFCEEALKDIENFYGMIPFYHNYSPV